MLKTIFQVLKKTCIIVVIIAVTIIIVRAFDALRMPDLEIWHTVARIGISGR